MSDGNGNNASSLLGPGGQPLASAFETAEIGGTKMRYLKDAGHVATPSDTQALVQMVVDHGASIHGMLREIVALRTRIEELEAASNKPCDEPEILV